MYDFLAFLGPNELSVIERCPYYRGVHIRRGYTVYVVKIIHTETWLPPQYAKQWILEFSSGTYSQTSLIRTPKGQNQVSALP